MTTIGVAIVALLVVGILVGLLVGATPVGPVMASGIAAGGNWVWSKVSTL